MFKGNELRQRIKTILPFLVGYSYDRKLYDAETTVFIYIALCIIQCHWDINNKQ